MEHILFILIMQMMVGGSLTVWWAGTHLVRERHDPGGWGYLAMGSLMMLLWSWLLLSRRGWLDFGLSIGVPTLLSIPVYWAYRSKERAKVFIGATLALTVSLPVLAVVVFFAVIPGGLLGYGGLATGALVSGLSVYLWRRYTLRTPTPDARQRAASGRWAAIGTILGLTVGAALVRGAMEVLAPELRAAVEAFFGGWLAFSILGCAAWQLLWEFKRQRG